MGRSFKQVDETERRLVHNMRKENLTWSTIQRSTGRTPDTLNAIINPTSNAPKTKGARKKIPVKVLPKLLKVTQKLQKNAKAEEEVTADMIITASGLKVSERTLLDTFHENGITFQKLKEKPSLTEDDIIERFAWTSDHLSVSKDGWNEEQHAIIDNSKKVMYINAKGRAYAARRKVRGAYQKRGEKPMPWLVREKKELKFSAPGVIVTAAVIKGRIRMWKYLEGPWNGKAAAQMYKGPLLQAMRRAFPAHAAKKRAVWKVLEDNDPSGYKSGKAKTAKSEVRIMTNDLPKRSPDLNVLDYCLWAEINTRMRAQEKAFPKSKKESRALFKARLRRTAMGLPESVVRKAVSDMHRRVRMVVAAEGGHINE